MDEVWNANLERAMEEASEFERRRYRSLSAGGKFAVLGLVAGGTHTLGEAVLESSGSFEEFLRSRGQNV